MTSVLTVSDVWKTYPLGDHQVHALRGVSVAIQRGDFAALFGPSGSGKSSLLHILGAMDRPTGNLDTDSGTAVLEVLADLHREGKTLVLVTHNPEVGSYANRVLTMRDGQLAG